MKDRSIFAQVFWALVLFFFGLPILVLLGLTILAKGTDILEENPSGLVWGALVIGATVFGAWLIERAVARAERRSAPHE